METDTQLVDYEVESKKLKEAQSRPPFWNPKAGKYEVVIKSEMEHYEYPNKKDANIMEKRAKVDVEAPNSDGKTELQTWSFGIGQTEASLYGQLIDYAKKHNSKLTGSKITLVVKSDGKKRDFTVV